jgi:cobalt/nickel transport system permease protein
VAGDHATRLTGIACDPRSLVRALDPRAKITGLLAVTLIAVSTPVSAWPAYGGCAGVLAAYAAAARVPAVELWRRWRLVLPLILLAAVLLPFARAGGSEHGLGPLTVHQEGLLVSAAVSAKATIGALSAVLLGATTTFPELLRGLEALRAPRLLVLIAAFMYRYVFVIVAEVARMRAAVAARGFAPRTALGAGATGRIVAALFLRTHARGERVYLAMLARGYSGVMPHAARLRLGRTDVAFVIAVLVVLVPVRMAA